METLNTQAQVLAIASLIVGIGLSEETYAATLNKKSKPQSSWQKRQEFIRGVMGVDRLPASKALALANDKQMFSFLSETIKSLRPSNDKKTINKIVRSILKEAERHQIDPILILAQVQNESTFQTDIVGSFGEIGLMQVKPSTALEIGKKIKVDMSDKNKLLDPAINIRIGVAYLMALKVRYGQYYRGSFVDAYNMGPANLLRKVKRGALMPSEYTLRVRTYANEHYKGFEQSVGLGAAKTARQVASLN